MLIVEFKALDCKVATPLTGSEVRMSSVKIRVVSSFGDWKESG